MSKWPIIRTLQGDEVAHWRRIKRGYHNQYQIKFYQDLYHMTLIPSAHKNANEAKTFLKVLKKVNKWHEQWNQFRLNFLCKMNTMKTACLMWSWNFLPSTKKITLGGRPRVREITIEISDLFVSYSISPKPIKLWFETEWIQSKLLWSLHKIDVKCWIQMFQSVVSLTLGLPP